MRTGQNTVGMESVIELIWSPEEVSALGRQHDHREQCGIVAPYLPPPPPPPPLPPPPPWVVRFVNPNVSCFG